MIINLSCVNKCLSKVLVVKRAMAEIRVFFMNCLTQLTSPGVLTLLRTWESAVPFSSYHVAMYASETQIMYYVRPWCVN